MSAAVAIKTRYTPDDLLAMPEGKGYELVEGQLVEKNMGAESSWVGGRLLCGSSDSVRNRGSAGPSLLTPVISAFPTTPEWFVYPMCRSSHWRTLCRKLVTQRLDHDCPRPGGRSRLSQGPRHRP